MLKSSQSSQRNKTLARRADRAPGGLHGSDAIGGRGSVWGTLQNGAARHHTFLKCDVGMEGWVMQAVLEQTEAKGAGGPGEEESALSSESGPLRAGEPAFQARSTHP